MIRRLWQRLQATPPREFEPVNAFLIQQSDSPLTVDHAVADASVAGAKRFVLGILLRDTGLQLHFPQALSRGLEGDYHRWLVGGGGQAYGLSDRAEEHITTVFTNPPTGDCPDFTDSGLALSEQLSRWPTDATLPWIDRLWLLIVHDETSTEQS